jgi:circadian clock protein KaiC
VNISSLVDSWLFVRDVEENGERNRVMYVLKSRGMSHSNQLRDFLLTRDGIDLLDRHERLEGSGNGSPRLRKAASDNNGGSTTKDRPFEARRLRQRK